MSSDPQPAATDFLAAMPVERLRELCYRQATDNTALRREVDLLRSDVLKLRTTGHAEPDGYIWPEPVNLLRTSAAVPLDDGDVPDVLGGYGLMWAREAGFDPTASIACAVVAAAAALDDGFRIEVSRATGWYESARLWAALLTPPGGGKSPAIREMTKPLREAHREQVEAYARQTAGLADDDQRPPRPALFTNDCTVEKLSEVLSDNPRGLLYVVEELDSWIGAHDAYRNGGGKDRGEWLQLYDGGPHQIDRVRRGSFFVPNWGVSLLSACTPSALKRYASKLPNDGLLQRVLPFMVQPPVAMRHVPGLSALRGEYEATQGRLLSYRAEGVAVVRMTDEAREVFATAATRFRELALACGTFNESLAGHVAKYGAMLARLALTFHAVIIAEEPSSRPVEADTVTLAVRFLDKAFRHARAFYAELGGSDNALALAQAVARFLLADNYPTIERRVLHQRCRAFRDATGDQRDAAMRLLVDCGWCIEVDGAYTRPHATRWAVNPRALERFAADGEAHRQMRKRLLESIQGGSEVTHDDP